jgi:L-fuconolactonase
MSGTIPPLTRREFVTGAVAATALVATTQAHAQEDAMIPVVDSHQHIWDLKRFHLPWTERDKPMARDFSMQDYLEATRGIPIEKSVYIEVDVEPSQQQAEADYMVELCRRKEGPLAAAVVSGRPIGDQFPAYARQFKDHPYVRGVRQVLHGPSTPAGYCLQKEFIAGIRALGELGLSFDIVIRPGELADAAKLIQACPGTQFILDHCGNASVQSPDLAPWRRDIATVAEQKNVICKISGIIAFVKPGEWQADDLAPIVNHALTVFGPDRVMYGGDWPVCNLGASYREWYDALNQIVADRSLSERRRLFHDNAIRYYRLA